MWNLKQCIHPSVQIEAHNGNPVLCCDVSSDGQWLLSGSTDKTIQVNCFGSYIALHCCDYGKVVKIVFPHICTLAVIKLAVLIHMCQHSTHTAVNTKKSIIVVLCNEFIT